MNLSFGTINNGIRVADAAGAYEWWYVDALCQTTGKGYVVIFFRGMAMSPNAMANPTDRASQHCGIAVSVYNNFAKVFFTYSEVPFEDCVFQHDGAYIKVGKSWLQTTGSTRTVHAEISAKHGIRSVLIHAEVTFEDISLNSVVANERCQDHGWNISQLQSEGLHNVWLFELGNAVGHLLWQSPMYHDHNWGSSPMHSAITDWHWARLLGNHNMAFLAVKYRSGWLAHFVSQGSLQACQTEQASFELLNKGISSMGLRPHRRIIVYPAHCGDVTMVDIHHKVVVENGPFYQRYISAWYANGKYLGMGTSEYLAAMRMKQAWIRPFLRLPLPKS
jgi:carotenoid 1,2-hydratase